MKTVAYKESYSWRSLKETYIRASLLLLIILVSILIWWMLKTYAQMFSTISKAFLLIFIYASLALFYIYTKDAYVDFFYRNFMGKKGEDDVESALKSALDDSYLYVKNYVVPDGRRGDIDGLLISRHEIIVIEVKSFRGQYDIVDGIFLKIRKMGRSRLSKNPIDQVEQQKRRLRALLDSNGMEHIYIRAILVFARGKIRRITGQTGIYVIDDKNKLVDFVRKESSAHEILNGSDTRPFVDMVMRNQKDH